MVYQSNNANESWDGYFMGEVVAQGNYHFRILMSIDENENPITFNGSISVLK